jgi:methionine-rich copper-binding protein CopC
VAVLLLASIVAATSTASAHAVFVSMNPADGSLQTQAPTQVVVTFNEAIQSIGAAVIVHAPSGASVTDGEPTVVDATVTQRLMPLTETGTYTVAYRVTSTDGHPVSKELTFAVGSRSASVPAGGAGPAASSSSSLPLLIAVLVSVVVLVVALVAFRRRRAATAAP